LRYARHAPLLLVPLAGALAILAPQRHNAIFLASMLAIVPLAGHIGNATEELAERLGGGIGGLINATFGNAAELIIGALALRAGLVDLVKASITGSIIGNVLLVFGAAAFSGGLRYRVQRFNRGASGMGATMLLLSAIGLSIPAIFHLLARRAEPLVAAGGPVPARELTLDTEIAVVLFLTYCASLIFTLKTHRDVYTSGGEPPAEGPARGAAVSAPVQSVKGAVWRLIAATAAVAEMSELLVDAVSETARAFGLTQLFLGVVVVAIVGNAAEHYSAVVMAMRNQMDAAVAIAIGSSTQIALFVAPVLVFLSYAIAPAPMDLLFSVFELVSIGVAVLVIAFIAHDGETNWMEGVQLLAVYAILALGFYFLPAR
jgi:Ca2+:H+ antiporter